jgi:hypothetical protein
MFLLRNFLHYLVSSSLYYLLSLDPNMLCCILFSNAVNSILLSLEIKCYIYIHTYIYIYIYISAGKFIVSVHIMVASIARIDRLLTSS